MGFFSKLFGKKKSDTKNALQSNDDNHNSNLSRSQNQQEDCLISFETFTGLNEDAIKEIVFKKTTDYNDKPDQNIL